MRSLLATALLMWAVPALLAQTPTEADIAQTKILALEDAWNQAEEHNDVKALASLLDPTLVYIDYDGSVMDKAKFIANVQAPSLHPEQMVNQSMSAQVYGDSAIVTGYREKGMRNGKPYLRHGRFTDTWVYRRGTGFVWQASPR
jgi:Domain of unknown function (DUF4440)